MRDLKFRQTKDKGWHYWGFINGKYIEPYYSPTEGYTASYQYINVKDKDGTEIYENDILKVDDGDDRIEYPSVQYENSSFCINYQYNDCDIWDIATLLTWFDNGCGSIEVVDWDLDKCEVR